MKAARSETASARSNPTNQPPVEPPAEEPSKHDGPAYKISMGRVRTAIWKNSTANGALYNVTFERLYLKEGEGWKSSSSFGVTDLLELAKAADLAHSWIREQSAAEEA